VSFLELEFAAIAAQTFLAAQTTNL